MRQRTISDFFWRDPEISDLSQEDKATLLYFLTSPSSNIIGCYQVVWAIAAAEMGWTKDQLTVVLKRLKSRGLIEFNDAGWVWVKIWWKHNSPQVALNPKSKLIQHAKKQFVSVPPEWFQNYELSLKTLGINLDAIGYQTTPNAPYHAPLDAPSENSQSPLGHGLDAPSDAPCHAPLDAPYHGGRGNRYLVSKTTTTPNPSFNPNEKTVVVDDLFFPPGLPVVRRDAIVAVLTASEVEPSHWQAILDELTGAINHGQKTANPITNPAGYVRAIASRAKNGDFLPEKGISVATQRELQKSLQRLDAVAAREGAHQLSEAEIERLPAALRQSLNRVLANKT